MKKNKGCFEKNFERFKLLLINYYDHISNVVSALISIVLSIIASTIYDNLRSENTKTHNVYIIITLVIFLLTLIVVVSIISKKIKSMLFKDENYYEYILKAYLGIQKLSLKNQEIFQDNCKGNIEKNNIKSWALKGMQLAVEECYNFFFTSFGNGVRLIEETKFEVTYMTESYKDGLITIPCSWNREGRTPISMLNREENPHIYDDTVTSDIYKEYKNHCKPSMKIVENTKEHYVFIYDNQKTRIKSSIVLPVLSHTSELLGTLVVHCDSTDFFKEKQRDFWYEIMQLFASEIGMYKLILDCVVEENDYPF